MGNARLGAIAIDCPDPGALADFYKDVLGMEVAMSSDELVVLRGAGVFLTFERVAEHVPPTWPAATIPTQLHLDLAVPKKRASLHAAPQSPMFSRGRTHGGSSSIRLAILSDHHTAALNFSTLSAPTVTTGGRLVSRDLRWF